MISKTMRAILHTLSYGNIEVESSRRLVDIKKLDAMNIFLKKMDIQIFNGDYEIPLRIYFPTEEAMTNGVEKGHTFPVLLFFHGGGWVTESVDTYNRVCARMSQSTGHIVVSVEYRLAPARSFCRLFLYLQEHGSLLIPHKYSFRCFHWQCYKVSFLLTPSSICFQVFSTFPLFSTTKSVWARKYSSLA